MKKDLVYLAGLLLVSVLMCGCSTKGYFVDRSITFKTEILFEFNSFDIKPSNKDILDAIVQKTKNNTVQIEIKGYSDSIGSDEKYNQWLSERRVEEVVDYLKSKGIGSDMKTTGVGSTQLAVLCSESNRARLIACNKPNRKVEIKLIIKNKSM